MCDFCDWEQARTDIITMLQQGCHALDAAKLERLQRAIELRQHATPFDKRLIVNLQNGEE